MAELPSERRWTPERARRWRDALEARLRTSEPPTSRADPMTEWEAWQWARAHDIDVSFIRPEHVADFRAKHEALVQSLLAEAS